MTPKLWGVAAGMAVLALLAGYFFFGHPGQPLLPSLQEKVISDLEAANKKAFEERESLKRDAQIAAFRATQAKGEAEAMRGRFRELEARYNELAQKRVFITDQAQALKELKTMGWVK